MLMYILNWQGYFIEKRMNKEIEKTEAILRKQQKLNNLYEEIKGCLACRLHNTRTQIVFGEGNPNNIIFVGEAPGQNEDIQGKPFVGTAGQILDELLVSVGLKREQIYIINIIKCRPPNNRNPLDDEIEACKPWLDKQIDIIRPAIIVSLGKFALSRFFPDKSIGNMHGKAKMEENVIYFAMYHPAATIYNRKLKQTMEEDMKRFSLVLKEFRI